MIIRVTPQGTLALDEANDFKGFKIAAPAGSAPDFLAKALKGVAAMEADGKTAWVSQQALRRWQGSAQAPEWVASFDKMVASVKKFGWVRDEDSTVRAHIELA